MRCDDLVAAVPSRIARVLPVGAHEAEGLLRGLVRGAQAAPEVRRAGLEAHSAVSATPVAQKIAIRVHTPSGVGGGAQLAGVGLGVVRARAPARVEVRAIPRLENNAELVSSRRRATRKTLSDTICKILFDTTYETFGTAKNWCSRVCVCPNCYLH